MSPNPVTELFPPGISSPSSATGRAEVCPARPRRKLLVLIPRRDFLQAGGGPALQQIVLVRFLEELASLLRTIARPAVRLLRVRADVVRVREVRGFRTALADEVRYVRERRAFYSPLRSLDHRRLNVGGIASQSGVSRRGTGEDLLDHSALNHHRDRVIVSGKVLGFPGAFTYQKSD